MEYIVPIKWTTNIKDIDTGKFIALVKVEPTEIEKKAGIKPHIERTFLEYVPLTGWCYSNADNTPLSPSAQVLAVADYQIWPSDEAVMQLCDTSNFENYGATERDFEDYFSDTFHEAHADEALSQEEIDKCLEKAGPIKFDRDDPRVKKFIEEEAARLTELEHKLGIDKWDPERKRKADEAWAKVFSVKK